MQSIALSVHGFYLLKSYFIYYSKSCSFRKYPDLNDDRDMSVPFLVLLSFWDTPFMRHLISHSSALSLLTGGD